MNKDEIISKVERFLDEIPKEAEISDFYIQGDGEHAKISIVISTKDGEDIDILGDYKRYMSSKLDIDFFT